jgi:hypothetical protein
MRPEDLNRIVAGDWVFRRGATLEEEFADLSSILAEQQRLYIRFERREGRRPVLVATGRFVYTPLDPSDPAATDHLVHFYLGKPPRKINGVAIGDRNGLLQAIGETLGREVFYETPNGSGPATLPAVHDWRAGSFTWSNHLPEGLTQVQILEAAPNIGKQLDLTFMAAQRQVSYWSATRTTNSASAD